MNQQLEQVVESALKKIQELNPNEFVLVKSLFDKIYNGAIGSSESWNNLRDSGFDESYEEAFRDLGDLISVPRTGALNILRDAFAEDAPDNIDFLDYQVDVIEEVYKRITDLQKS